MLSPPQFTQSLLDNLEDNFLIYPLHPACALTKKAVQQQQQQQLAVPRIKDNKYTLSLDLRHFDPSEVSVKFDDQNRLQISGKREKKSEDGSHYEYREYQHHFSVPDNVLSDQLKCQLNDKGFLQIEAPVQVAVEDNKQRSIPIEFVKK